ncbi:MAG: SIMPL domain-containing protein [Desulfobacterales bacterium]|nr:SIMPL domain-containing protein [Desulfobacterales bacterium]
MGFPIRPLFLIAFLFWIAPPVTAAGIDGPATIEVVGRGDVSQRPDRAILRLAIESNAADANEAIRQNAAQAEKLISRLKKMMTPDDRIATTQFQLHPVYSQKARITPSSYRVNNTVQLETGQLDRLGAFIDAAAQAGSVRIGQLQFHHSRQGALARKAAALAVADARRIADELARAAGVKIVRLHQLRYTGNHHPAPMRAEMAMAAAPTPIEIGDLKITERVVTVFIVE